MPDTTVVTPQPPAGILPSGLLAALHRLQAEHGYIPRRKAQELSAEMNIPLARIFEVLTFYSFFRLEAPGAIRIAVCLGTSCHLQGGHELLAELENLLGIKAGSSTPDGLFLLEVVRCLGCCGRSPVIMVDGTVYSQVEVSDLPAILRRAAERQGGTAPA